MEVLKQLTLSELKIIITEIIHEVGNNKGLVFKQLEMKSQQDGFMYDGKEANQIIGDLL